MRRYVCSRRPAGRTPIHTTMPWLSLPTKLAFTLKTAPGSHLLEWGLCTSPHTLWGCHFQPPTWPSQTGPGTKRRLQNPACYLFIWIPPVSRCPCLWVSILPGSGQRGFQKQRRAQVLACLQIESLWPADYLPSHDEGSGHGELYHVASPQSIHS